MEFISDDLGIFVAQWRTLTPEGAALEDFLAKFHFLTPFGGHVGIHVGALLVTWAR